MAEPPACVSKNVAPSNRSSINIIWAAVSGGMNMMTGTAFTGNTKIWTEHSKDRIGTVYRKALFREYTDDTFATEKKRPPEWEHLGVLGPLIRAEVGDAKAGLQNILNA